jgi:hypothetical protein
MVEEAYGYVQGESLKPYATLLVLVCELPDHQEGSQMRIAVFAFFFAASAVAQPMPAQIPEPGPQDDEGWNLYCNGLYAEISRQAIEGNNPLEMNDANDKRSSLASKWIVFQHRGVWNGGLEQFDYWTAAGRMRAGASVWDFQPMMPDRDIHGVVRVARIPYERRCADLATDAAGFVVEAHALLDTMK